MYSLVVLSINEVPNSGFGVSRHSECLETITQMRGIIYIIIGEHNNGAY